MPLGISSESNVLEGVSKPCLELLRARTLQTLVDRQHKNFVAVLLNTVRQEPCLTVRSHCLQCLIRNTVPTRTLLTVGGLIPYELYAPSVMSMLYMWLCTAELWACLGSFCSQTLRVSA